MCGKGNFRSSVFSLGVLAHCPHLRHHGRQCCRCRHRSHRSYSFRSSASVLRSQTCHHARLQMSRRRPCLRKVRRNRRPSLRTGQAGSLPHQMLLGRLRLITYVHVCDVLMAHLHPVCGEILPATRGMYKVVGECERASRWLSWDNIYSRVSTHLLFKF